VPISALDGDNVVNRSERSPWYKGETLMEIFESVPIAGDKNYSDFRFPVQYVNRPNLDFRGFCGNVASGVVNVGDQVRVLPSGKTSHVKSIVTYDGEQQQAFYGQAVTLTLTDEVDVSRGDMLVLAKDVVAQSNHLKAHVVWMAEKVMQVGTDYLFKFASKVVSGQVEAIEYRIDVNTQEHSHIAQLQLNDIAVVDVLLTQPVVADKYKNNRATGAFIVIDRLTNITVGAGMVVEQLQHKTASVTNYSEFEVELNALIRKHFPHWGATDLKQLLK
jgi:sulfate adenylyltransferase subunit 1